MRLLGVPWHVEHRDIDIPCCTPTDVSWALVRGQGQSFILIDVLHIVPKWGVRPSDC